MQQMSFYKILVLSVFSSLLLTTSCRTISESLVNVNCVYSFKDVKNEADQQALENAIVSVIGSDFEKAGTDESPKYTFIVNNASQIDEIHKNISSLKSGKGASQIFGNRSSQSSAFYMEKPEYRVTYGSLGLEAQIEVIVKFKITPGSKLWYKPEGKIEIDITDKVDKNGNVKLNTSIFKNQEYILGRTSYKGAERFIQVNIFSGEVQEINKKNYH